jgi:hypothetical protein
LSPLLIILLAHETIMTEKGYIAFDLPAKSLGSKRKSRAASYETG